MGRSGVEKQAEVSRQSKTVPTAGTIRAAGKPHNKRISIVISESEMHASSPALEASASVTRIAVAMRFDSDDGLGYSRIDLDGHAGLMFRLIGKRNGRHGEDHRYAGVGRHGSHQSAQAAALSAHVIVGDRTGTIRGVLVNDHTAVVVSLHITMGKMTVLMIHHGLLSNGDWSVRMMLGIALPCRDTTRGK
jgi:hypothetical protein